MSPKPILTKMARALGRWLSHAKDPYYLAAGTAATATGVYVISPAGKKIWAKLTGHFHHDDGKIGDHHTDDAGNEYVVINGKTYRHDPVTDNFYHATPEK